MAACFGQNFPQQDSGRRYNDQNSNRRYNDQNSAQRYDERNYPQSIPAGTTIRVRNDQTIDVQDRSNGRIYTGTVSEDVLGSGGQPIIPRGARAELIVHNIRDNEMAVDLDSITVQGHRYMVTAEQYNDSRRTGVGANRRTGEYVGGGALLGTLLGAIAGGGKGAAIGALAGGAAGAGTQVLTRGHTVRVPAETVLSFRLEQPFELGSGDYSRDRGFDRDGNHYHDNYYRRQPEQ